VGFVGDCRCESCRKTFCKCEDVEYGPMIACNDEDCPYEWFHWGCEGSAVLVGRHELQIEKLTLFDLERAYPKRKALNSETHKYLVPLPPSRVCLYFDTRIHAYCYM